MELHYAFASFFIRSFLGFLFLFQGYDKIYNIGVAKVMQTFESSLLRLIPRRLVLTGIYLSSYIEFIGGILLVLGLFKFWTLYILGFDLVMVSFLFGWMNPMWDMKYVFPRLLLLVSLLLLPAGWDIYCLDNLFSLISIVRE